MCVSARDNGKTVVTGLWVDHCFDIGLAVDPTSIMYQPPKDFSGIPGAKNLTVCLTGYQRQDREDIMTMVRLMGAQFSKPLVATKITHLICYKFEGEKYELARRMQKIKLVNHRWLEDCLRNWKLLPEEEYNKSGYELEMMEAEAGDSEDDVPATALKPSTIRIANKSPQITETGPPKICDLSKSTSEPSTMQNVREVLSTIPNAENVLLAPVCSVEGHVSDSIAGPLERTPGSAKAGNNKVDSISGSIEKPSHSTLKLSARSYSRRTPQRSPSTIQNVPEGLSTIPSAENVLLAPVCSIEGHVSHSIAGPSERTPDSAKAGSNKVDSVSGSIKKPSHSTLKLTAQSYSRRTPQRSPSPLSVSASKSIWRSQKVQTGELTNVSSVEVEDANGRCGSGSETSGRLLSTEQSDGEKQEINASKANFKSREIDQDRQACLTESSSVLHSNLPDGDPVPFSNGMVSPIAASNSNSNSSEDAKLKEKSLANGVLPFSGDTALHETENQRTDLKLQSSLCESKESNSPSNQDTGDLFAEKSKPYADLCNHQGVDSLASKTILETEKTPILTTFDMEQGQDDGLLPKQVKQQTATKKTLRTRLNVERTTKKKGSVHSKESAGQKDATIDSRRGDDKTNDKEKASMSKEFENPVSSVAPPAENVERELAFDDLRSNVEDKTRFMDDVPDLKKKDESISEDHSGDRRKKIKGQGRQPSSKSKRAKASTANDKSNSNHSIQKEETHLPDSKKKKLSRKRPQSSLEADKENNPDVELHINGSHVESAEHGEPMCFILSGGRPQRKEFQQVIKRLKGKSCKDSHQWSYQATHFIAPDPIRRTEKFFAASASGSWILKPDYLAACTQAGKFVPAEPYELYKNGLSEDGAVNLEAPRKWRLLRERTGHGAFHGMRIVVYGQCIAPPLDTLKRVVKAGDGVIVATSPPYSRFLASGKVDYAVVGPGIPGADVWVQQFLRHEIPCVAADYLVEYVCKSGYSLDKHVLYNTQKWAEKSFTKLSIKAEEVIVGQDGLLSSSSEESSRKKRKNGEKVILGSKE
ncbi:BRCT domain-containing protein At4g02110 [Linum grandiflorum]